MVRNARNIFTRLLLALLLATLLSGEAYAALSGSIFEIESAATAGNVNGGGFDPLNANFLTDGAATSATGNTASFTSASYSFVAGDVNAKLWIKSGTNWNPKCWYVIGSVSAGAAILNSAIGQGVCADANYKYFTAAAVAGIASTASPTSATWGIDYSQQTAADTTGTDLATVNGTTNPCAVTSSSLPFGVQDVGNFLNISAGSSWTPNFYEIVSVSTVTATLDKACGSSATLTGGTYHMGGAVSLNGSTTGITDAVFLSIGVGGSTIGGHYFIKNGSYTLAAAPTFGTSSNSLFPVIAEGYNTVRGDLPTGTTRPAITAGSNQITGPAGGTLRNLNINGTADPVVLMAGSGNNYSFTLDSKIVNKSTTSGRSALALTAGQNYVLRNELSSYRGYALKNSSATNDVNGNYIHDSDYCVNNLSNDDGHFHNNIFLNCVTYGLNESAAASVDLIVEGNTFVGSPSKNGTGIHLANSAGFDGYLQNNIFTGWTTAIDPDTAGTHPLDEYNDFFNNTTDITAAKFLKSPSDIAVDPAFKSLAALTGTTATTTAGNHLVQSGGTFSSSGVVAGRDYLRIKSGTSVTVGMYGILSVDSDTQITTDITITANATADKSWEIITGRDLTPSGTVSAAGWPGTFSGGYQTSTRAMGAVNKAGGGTTGSAYVH